MYYIAYHSLQPNEKENLPLGQSEPTTAELLEIEDCDQQIADHEKMRETHPHLFWGNDERRFTPTMLWKPFEHVLLETAGGKTFLRELANAMVYIQGSQEAGKVYFIDSLTKALKDRDINRESLLQWLTTHGQKQLVLMSNNKASSLEGLDNCQILREISDRWKLSNYPLN